MAHMHVGMTIEVPDDSDREAIRHLRERIHEEYDIPVKGRRLKLILADLLGTVLSSGLLHDDIPVEVGGVVIGRLG